jgi:FkbM family methyltransferase
MTWRTSRATIGLRNILRGVGLTRLIGAWRQRHDHEAEFAKRMLCRVGGGVTVWDVGANVGLYTRQFAARVGEDGRVIAFEPNPTALPELRALASRFENVRVVPIALGAKNGWAVYDPGDRLHDAAGHIIDKTPGSPGRDLDVPIRTGDALVADGLIAVPNVVKIDTEGYELDVLQGMRGLLQHAALQAVCVEVHFGLLSRRGIDTAPLEIERLLVDAGFEMQWTDSSHVVATRESIPVSMAR